jgi:class 3 adenylate cyclase/pimeloyl-ACP methyl ester carboxylesterase
MMPDAPAVQFATTSDGVRIAFCAQGDGPPLVYMPGWVSHLELDWQTDEIRSFFLKLGHGRRLIRFDGRGTGLSDRDVDEVSHETHIRDLEAVVEHLSLDTFDLFTWSQRTPAAMLYAASNPDRLEHLVLFAAYCGGPDEDGDKSLIRAIVDLIRAEWGVGARTTIGFVHPDADKEQEQRSLRYLRAASSGEVAARILEVGYLRTNVCQELARVVAPVLVLHRSGDNAVPVQAGRAVAAELANARFVLLEGDHHLPYEGDADAILRAVGEFLGAATAPAWRPPPSWPAVDFSAPVTLLFTDLEGSTTLTDRLGDARAQQVLHEHDDIVRDALLANGGTEIKHTGDGIMASFASASRALECAVRIQRAVAQRNEEQPDLPIRVRIGLNCGEPVRERDDLFGTAVQLARRICDQAEPSKILVSNVVRELVAGKGFLFADMGEMALRGFEDPVRVYEVAWEA